MKNPRFATLMGFAAGVTALVAGDLVAEQELTLPARFRSTLMIVDFRTPGTTKVEIAGTAGPPQAPGTVRVTAPSPVVTVSRGQASVRKFTSALLTVTIDRWSTEEETAALAGSLKSGGTLALASEMEKATVGYLHLNGDLREPIRWASTWNTEKGRRVCLATSRPILGSEFAAGPGSPPYPIGIVEFTLPSSGRGEGTLVEATRVKFDEHGRIHALALPIGEGFQRLSNVEREELTAAGDRD